LARAVAGCIVAALGRRPSKPNKILSLGDESLLAMNMAAASRFWGIEAPIGKRDRKSGQRKRKQVDIEAERVKALSYA
jgi:DNA (cytosine-5)-methyltransferase 1